MTRPHSSDLKLEIMDGANAIFAIEKFGDQGTQIKYVRQEGTDRLRILSTRKTLTSLNQLFTSAFLPQGYPHSVSEDYLIYQMWDTVQGFASSITGTLSTLAVLKGVGVGNEAATPMAATITWLLKDGTGMLGRILFAWLRGSDLDSHCKQWRLFADVLNDVAICLELLAQFFEATLFTAVICVAGVFKAIVGVAGGATRAALVQHQSRRDNLADVSAKDGSQETLVNLAALICSLIIIPAIGSNQSFVWLLYGIFTCMHLYANCMAISSLMMDTFNQERYFIAIQHYLLSGGSVLSRKNVNQLEPIIFPFTFPLKIRLGCSLNRVIDSYSHFAMLSEDRKQSKYLLNIDSKKGEVNIALHESSDTYDKLKACFEAMLLAVCNDNIFKGISGLTFHQLEEITAELERRAYDTSTILKLSNKFTTEQFPIFIQRVEKSGWKTDKAHLGSDEWRATWNVTDINIHQSTY